MGIRLDVKPELIVKSRIVVLHDIVHEVVKGFGANKGSLDVIKKGVLGKQLLSQIIINYLDNDGKLVGLITISIDWEKHQAFASSDGGDEFRLDQTQSISRQISGIYPHLVDHSRRMKKAFSVHDISVQYRFRSDIYSDREKLQEARNFLGTSLGENYEWKVDGPEEHKPNPPDDDLDIEMEFVSKKMRELRILVQHNKPKKPK